MEWPLTDSLDRSSIIGLIKPAPNRGYSFRRSLISRPRLSFSFDDDVAVLFAQFYLPNVSAHAVNFLGYQGRAPWAAAGFALRNVFTAVNANGRRGGIEVGLEHMMLPQFGLSV